MSYDYLEALKRRSQYDVKKKKQNANDKICAMLNRSTRFVEYGNLPDTITRRDIELLLQTEGYAFGIVNDEKPYIIRGSLAGPLNQNFFFTGGIVANPFLNINGKRYELGKDAVLFKNDTMMMGLLPIFSYYANELAENELSMHMSIVNARAPVIMAAGNDEAKESAELFIKKIENGELSIIANDEFLNDVNGFQTFENKSGTNNNILNLIEYEQYLEGSWLNKIGIRAPFNMKREALGDSEVSQADMSLLPLIDDMFECRQESIKQFNKLFGTNITVKYNTAWKYIQEEVKQEEERTKEEKENDTTKRSDTDNGEAINRDDPR